ncbi:hypothetical protein BDR04DRAFT_1143935 [Suillus decipiens]|nr:hypothetical protein BDR04DRAFT_1143935 [Suillus decipiens]
MEYSSDNIAAARSLQFITYIFASTATFWLYDYACSLHEEWSFLLRSHWSKVKGLYIITRYAPFIVLITIIYLGFTPNETPGKCRMVSNICSGFSMLSAIGSEGFFILRTCTLWNNNRTLLTVMLVTVLAFVGASIGVTAATIAPAAYTTSTIPGITGCYRSSGSFQLFIPYLLLSAFELALMILTIVRAIQNWQMNSSHLYVVLVRHNIFYYICGFLFSVANILISLLLDYSYDDVLHVFQFMILAILATRMHLDLWQMNQHTHGSDALARIPVSDMAMA